MKQIILELEHGHIVPKLCWLLDKSTKALTYLPFSRESYLFLEMFVVDVLPPVKVKWSLYLSPFCLKIGKLKVEIF